MPSAVASADFATGTTEVATLKEGGDTTITVVKSDDGAVTVDGTNVVTVDLKADNGVIHVFDKVILPSD